MARWRQRVGGPLRRDDLIKETDEMPSAGFLTEPPTMLGAVLIAQAGWLSPVPPVPAAAVPHRTACTRHAAIILMSSQKPKRRQFKASSHTKCKSHWKENTFSSENTVGRVTRVETPTLTTALSPLPKTGMIPIGGYPALVLNADYTPLSFVPLSLWSWQDSVKAVCREAVVVLSCYDGGNGAPAAHASSHSMCTPGWPRHPLLHSPRVPQCP